MFAHWVKLAAVWVTVALAAGCEGGGSDVRANGPGQEEGREQEAEVVPEQLERLGQAEVEFGLALFGQLRGGGEENVFFSPHSVATALMMTYAGAEGRTEREFVDVLRLPYEEVELHATVAALQERLAEAAGGGEEAEESSQEGAQEEAPGVEVYVANRLWGQQGYEFRREFVELLGRYYGSELAEVDFRQAEQAAERINEWVAQQTRGTIEDLMAPGMLNELTRLVLTNAVYFKGSWALPFDAGRTAPMQFRTMRGDNIEVQAMRQESRLGYFKAPAAALLEMDYAGGEMSMVVVLPDAGEEGGGVEEFEKALSEEELREWVGQIRRRMVEVYLPRFELETKYRLNGPLQEMGMATAFDPQEADFSGMTAREDLFIQVVVHQAFVTVDEEGTEAGAATGVGVGVTALPPEPVVFRADRPFLVLIREKQTGAVLFMGRVGNPLASGVAGSGN